MDKGKNGFIFYKNYCDGFNLLNDEQLGKLFRMLCQDFFEGKFDATIELDAVTKYAFEVMRKQIKTHHEQYILKCEVNRENGCKGGRPKGNNRKNRTVILKTEANQNKPEITEANRTEPYNTNTNTNTNIKESDLNSEGFTSRVSDLKKVSIAHSPSSDDEENSNEEFYLTKKGRKLRGKRLETFERFWEAFDYKRGKASAADAWLNIPLLTDSLVEKIIQSAKVEANHRIEAVNAGITPKWAEGWITSRRWEDETFSPITKMTANDLKAEQIKREWLNQGD